MDEEDKKGDERWIKIQKSLDLLFSQVESIHNSQKQLGAQMELIAKTLNQSSQDQLLLAKQLQATGEAVSRLTMWQIKMEADNRSDSARSGTDDGNWFGNMAGPSHTAGTLHGRDRRATEHHQRSYLPKMSFPRFDGVDPIIWRDKCEEYFKLFNISDLMKTSAASLNLEGNAAKWYQVFKLQNGLVDWERFISAVENKFGAYDYKKAIDLLLELKQEGTVEEYTKEFESIQFQVTMHNPHYDDLFFASHYVKGLKDELRGAVQSQVPETVDKASFLAKVQQQVLEKRKFKSLKNPLTSRAGPFPAKNDAASPSVTSGLWKERQLRDFRKANGLCYFCGEEFDANHAAQCAKRTKPQLNALALNDLDTILTEDTLNQLAIEDEFSKNLCQLSLNAISGTESQDCTRVRSRLGLPVQSMKPVAVKVANGDSLVTDSVIPDMEWWAHGHIGGDAFRLSDEPGAGVLKLHKGDITEWLVDGATDAIVNAADERMLGGGGVDEAIHGAAGPELVQACRKVPEVKPGVRCPTGEARITPAFKLPVSRVIHTVGPIYDVDKKSEVLLKNAYESSLKLAKENGIQYIAFPAISCGLFRYPPKEASKIAISTARQFSKDIKEVHFVLFLDHIYNIWHETAQEMLSQAGN